MKNLHIKNDFSKDWKYNLFASILTSLPIILFTMPVGCDSIFNNYKWIVYASIVILYISLNAAHLRAEHNEEVIEQLNEEIEELKKKLEDNGR